MTGEPKTTRSADDPFRDVELHELDFERHARDALAFVSEGGGEWKERRGDAYLLWFERVGSSYDRVTSRCALPLWTVQLVERMLRAVGGELAQRRLGIHAWSASQGLGRIWLEVDWDHWQGVPAFPAFPGGPGVGEALRALEETLRELEARGVVHGGIEPACLRFRRCSDGRLELRLVGFACAWMAAAQRGEKFDGLGTSVGDPRFMAPEVAEGLAPSPESDRFSAALALLSSLHLTGPVEADRNPLLGVEGMERRLAIPSSAWFSSELEYSERGVPPVVLVQLRAMLDPQPSRRVWIAREVSRAAAEANVAATPIAVPAPPLSEGVRPRSPRWTADAIAALILFALTVGWGAFKGVFTGASPSPSGAEVATAPRATTTIARPDVSVSVSAGVGNNSGGAAPLDPRTPADPATSGTSVASADAGADATDGEAKPAATASLRSNSPKPSHTTNKDGKSKTQPLPSALSAAPSPLAHPATVDDKGSKGNVPPVFIPAPKEGATGAATAEQPKLHMDQPTH